MEYYASGIFNVDKGNQESLEALQNMMMGMHYQGGLDIDPDKMTYEELLQL